MEEPVITFEDVSKKYRLGGGPGSLADALGGLFGRDEANLWALRDVSFAVRRGESLGIIGPNGAGKTTILKLLAGITAPSRGRVYVKGRVSALIELGAGFHPELTGRENIYLYGAILGLKRAEISSLFERIVAFSELELFLDTPLKRYSWGMQARLAFAVAAQVEPEVLLVDEVLSVGDAAYQVKCARRMGELRKQGTTIVFVSHYLDLIVEMCDRAIFLDEGEIKYIGGAQEAVNIYQESLRQATPTGLGARRGSFEVEITAVHLLDGSGQERADFHLGEEMVVRIEFLAHVPVENPVFGVEITRSDGLYCYATNTRWDGVQAGRISGPGCIELKIARLNLSAGTYFIGVGILEKNAIAFYDFHDKAYRFEVHTTKHDRGVLYLEHRWRMGNGG